MAAVPTFAFPPGCVQMALSTIGLAPAPHSGHSRSHSTNASSSSTATALQAGEHKRKVEPIRGAELGLCATNATTVSCRLDSLNHPSASRIDTPLQLLLMYCL
jgi:hypothetical protein